MNLVLSNCKHICNLNEPTYKPKTTKEFVKPKKEIFKNTLRCDDKERELFDMNRSIRIL